MGRRSPWVPAMIAAVAGGAASGATGGVVVHAVSDIGAEDHDLV